MVEMRRGGRGGTSGVGDAASVISTEPASSPGDAVKKKPAGLGGVARRRVQKSRPPPRGEVEDAAARDYAHNYGYGHGRGYGQGDRPDDSTASDDAALSAALAASRGGSMPSPEYHDSAGSWSSYSYASDWSDSSAGREGRAASSYHYDDPEMLHRQALLPPSPHPSFGLSHYPPPTVVAQDGGSPRGGTRRRRDVTTEHTYASYRDGGGGGNHGHHSSGKRRGKRRRPRTLLGRIGRTATKAVIYYLPGLERFVKRKRRRKGVSSSFFSSPATAYDQNSKGQSSSFLGVPLAVVAWYSLGVLSISTSKILVTNPANRPGYGRGGNDINPMDYIGGVGPLTLTVQQFCVGVMMLTLLGGGQGGSHRGRRKGQGTGSAPLGVFSAFFAENRDLRIASFCFALGFLATNFGFRAGAASFVETIKASEPITSAGAAAFGGVEVPGREEVCGLAGIVAGVMLSTLGHTGGSGSRAAAIGGLPLSSTRSSTLRTCAIVMLSNLCFSFRGLHQKLFRSSRGGSAREVDDVALQWKMQRTGILLFLVPMMVLDMPRSLGTVWWISRKVGLIRSGVLIRYMGFSLVNGIAFTSYNLASTYILTRISVVHHAALNCIRRLFAIVITSVLFGVPITPLAALGIVVSVAGFATYAHFKTKRLQQPRPLSSLLPVSAE